MDRLLCCRPKPRKPLKSPESATRAVRLTTNPTQTLPLTITGIAQPTGVANPSTIGAATLKTDDNHVPSNLDPQVTTKELRRQLTELEPEQVSMILQTDFGLYDIVVGDLQRAFDAKGHGAKIQHLERFIVPLHGFAQGVGGILQAADATQIGQIVWGSVALVLSLLARFTDVLDHVQICLEDLSKCLPRLETLSVLFPTPGVSGALMDIGKTCAEFLVRVAVILKRRTALNIFHMAWSSSDKELVRIKTAIGKRRQDFNEEVTLAHMASVSRFQEQAEAGSGPLQGPEKIPCRVVPFAMDQGSFPRPAITHKTETHLEPNKDQQHGKFRAFLLHGLGGCGKTKLAAQYVQAHWEDYDVILWIGADNQQTLSETFLASATALGLTKGGESNDLVKTTLHRWLQDTKRKWLMVFDNADDPSQVDKYWPPVMSGSLLITSRDPMLDMSLITERCEVDCLDSNEGGNMLLSILKRNTAAGPTDTADKSLSREISEALGGIPLAISQMAGFMLKTHMPMERFLPLYRDRDQADILNAGNTSVDHYQYCHTLDSVWRMSFERLSADAYLLLCLTAFLYPDEIPEELFSPSQQKCEMVTMASNLDNVVTFNIALGDLLGESLLKRNVKECISIHRQVQSQVLKQMAKGTDEQFVIAFSMATSLLHRVFPRQSPLGEPIPDWPTCEVYTKHVLILADRFEQYGALCKDSINALRLLTELLCDCGVYLWARGRMADSERLANASIRIAEMVLDLHDCLRAQPYTLLGCVYLHREGKTEDAGIALQKALEIRQENLKIDYKDTAPPLHIDIQLANAYSNLGIQRKQAKSYEEAALLQNRSLEIKTKYPAEDMDFLLALSYNNLGKVKLLQGELEDAARLMGRSVTTMKRSTVEMQSRRANFMVDQAEAEESLGHAAHALDGYLEAIKILKSTLGETSDTGYAVYRLAALLYRQGKYNEALMHVENANAIFEQAQLASDTKLASSWSLLGLIYGKLDNEAKMKHYEDKARERYTATTRQECTECGEAAWKLYDSSLMHA